jgi:hypothetical protein
MRSVVTNLARRFNAGISSSLRTLSGFFPGLKGRAKFVVTLRGEKLFCSI